jgi:hypothetical protein
LRIFFKNLPFNGELSVEALENVIQEVNGVRDLQKLEVSSQWIEPGTGYGLFQPLRSAGSPNQGGLKLKTGAE